MASDHRRHASSETLHHGSGATSAAFLAAGCQRAHQHGVILSELIADHARPAPPHGPHAPGTTTHAA